MVRIAIARRADLGSIDGVNRFIFVLADGLKRLDNEVMIFGHHATGNPIEFFGVDAEINTISDHGEGSLIKIMWDWYIRGSKLLRDFRPEILIVNGVVPLRLRAFKIAVNHGNAVFELRGSYLKRFITKRLYSTYDHVVCVSSKVAGEMGELKVRCDEIIPIPIILDNYSPNAGRRNIILHVGTTL
ncbi:MAG: glycosyltransferase family 4 protein [Desulfurococcaceae archaeon]